MEIPSLAVPVFLGSVRLRAGTSQRNADERTARWGSSPNVVSGDAQRLAQAVTLSTPFRPHIHRDQLYSHRLVRRQTDRHNSRTMASPAEADREIPDARLGDSIQGLIGDERVKRTMVLVARAVLDRAR